MGLCSMKIGTQLDRVSLKAIGRDEIGFPVTKKVLYWNEYKMPSLFLLLLLNQVSANWKWTGLDMILTVYKWNETGRDMTCVCSRNLERYMINRDPVLSCSVRWDMINPLKRSGLFVYISDQPSNALFFLYISDEPNSSPGLLVGPRNGLDRCAGSNYYRTAPSVSKSCGHGRATILDDARLGSAWSPLHFSLAPRTRGWWNYQAYVIGHDSLRTVHTQHQLSNDRTWCRCNAFPGTISICGCLEKANKKVCRSSLLDVIERLILWYHITTT